MDGIALRCGVAAAMDVELSGNCDLGDRTERGANFALRFVEPSGAVRFEEIEQVAAGFLVHNP
jgi:hypothetical protein